MRETAAKAATELREIGGGVYYLDLCDSGLPDRTSGYLIVGEKLALVESGPGPSGPLVLEAIGAKGFAQEDLAYVIVTHLHLDHAGAAGYILQQCPGAKLVVHPRGARFMIDPTVLVEGSRSFFPDFEKTMLPVYPIPEERVIRIEDNGAIDLGGRVLVFRHGEGHSRTHFTVWDEGTRGVFTGDAAGLIYPELEERQIVFCFPATVPNQFEPAAYRESLGKIRELQPGILYYSHFGPSGARPELYFECCLEMLDCLVRATGEIMTATNGAAPWESVAEKMKEIAAAELQSRGLPPGQPIPELLWRDIIINAQGIVDWWKRQQRR